MKLKHYLLVCVSLLTLASCSEQDDTVEEFADWQARNESYFTNLYNQTQQKVASGDKSWKIIRSYTKADSSRVTTPESNIIVEVLGESDGASYDSPLFTDSVKVHYSGWLIPSVNYPDGYNFDHSYRDNYEEGVSTPTEFSLNSNLVLGFSTAVQHMHRGDHWLVYIPYQLGYGTTSYSSIPAFSTLIFEVYLEDFWN